MADRAFPHLVAEPLPPVDVIAVPTAAQPLEGEPQRSVVTLKAPGGWEVHLESDLDGTAAMAQALVGMERLVGCQPAERTGQHL